MVELTKLNGDRLFLNEYWIEAVESVPDTTITLSSGNKVVVLEKMEEVLKKIVYWQARLRGEGEKAGRKVRKRK